MSIEIRIWVAYLFAFFLTILDPTGSFAIVLMLWATNLTLVEIYKRMK